MIEQNQSLEELQHIKKMMERSGRFISLSGLSGIAAGACALIGACFAEFYIHDWAINYWVGQDFPPGQAAVGNGARLLDHLIVIAVLTFIGALLTAFLFTYLKTRRDKALMWSNATLRLFWNTVIPIAVGAVFLLKMMEFGDFGLIAPGCLIFYGLALVNASKYTLGEIRYLGYGQLILGMMNLSLIGYGLYFWAIGFGVLHIVYGAAMWWKYERNVQA